MARIDVVKVFSGITDVASFVGNYVRSSFGSVASSVPPEVRARQIQIARALQGFTQRELAQRAGVTITTLYRAEKGLPVREGSLAKIAEGLNIELNHMLKERPVMRPGAQSYALHRSAENVWFAPIDRRRNVPEDSEKLVGSSAERRRLGGLGLSPIFACYPRIIMPEGPGATLIEVYGHYPHAFNPKIYRECMIHCLAGGVRLKILDDVVELGAGDFVGFVSRNLCWIEPTGPLGANDPTPLALWFGAVRLGRVYLDETKRAIVRKPRKPV